MSEVSPSTNAHLRDELRQNEVERLKSLPQIPNNPDLEDIERIGTGVLLSDGIRHMQKKYQMIDPFDSEQCLKPAAYELRVGCLYGKGGQAHELQKGESLTIEPFNVVIIQTLETLNLPPFLIARWNIRVRWAYKGLLWVGAPQVDPGYRGHLSCPLYNLSNQPVSLPFEEPIATMDFVRTAEFTSSSTPYPWSTRTRVIFHDYVNSENRLESALYELANSGVKETKQKTELFEGQLAGHQKLIEKIEKSVKENVALMQGEIQKGTEDVQSRVDRHSTATFTVLAVLVAALGVVVTRSPLPSYFDAGIGIVAIAFYFALRAFLRRGETSVATQWRWFEAVVGVVVAILLVMGQLYFGRAYRSDLNNLESTLQQVQSERGTLQQRLTDQQAQIESLQRSIGPETTVRVRLDTIQAELDSLGKK